jgi:hypothetical protein
MPRDPSHVRGQILAISIIIALFPVRAFPGKVDTGFPIENATNIEPRALSGREPCNFRVNLIGKRSGSVTASYVKPRGAQWSASFARTAAAPSTTAQACDFGSARSLHLLLAGAASVEPKGW